jgi:hypothetical protein
MAIYYAFQRSGSRASGAISACWRIEAYSQILHVVPPVPVTRKTKEQLMDTL